MQWPKVWKLLVLVFTLALIVLVAGCRGKVIPDPPVKPGSIFVAPNGKASNPGTIGEPTTLVQALTMVKPGGAIYLRDGTYSYSTQITIARGNNGEAGKRKEIFAYPAEEPLLDFSPQPYNSDDPSKNPRGLQINGDYWHVKGLKVKGSADNGIFIGGNYNIIENCETYENRDSGLQLGRYSSSVTNIEGWPSYNLILNCYSHDNYDPDDGEDADGFGCKLTTGYGNVFRGCIAAYNVDDGWDLYTKKDTGPIGPVTLENCIAHHNGRTSDGGSSDDGDKNGFKLGGEKIAVDHIVKNCIAFSNINHGFDCNSNTGSMTITNCTAFDNAETSGKYNFNFHVGTHTFVNNLSYKPARLGNNDHSIYDGNPNNIDVDGKNVVWRNNQATSASGLKVNDSDFVSLTVPTEVLRKVDGSPELGDFLALASGSGLIGAGTGGVNIGAWGNQ